MPDAMVETEILLQIAVSTVTLAVLLVGIYKMVRATAAAVLARASASAAVLRAENAAVLAADHARDATEATLRNSTELAKLVTSTNGMKDALIASVAKASDLEGEKRGIALGVEQEKANPTA
jgi:predicted nucleic acid-binding protein